MSVATGARTSFEKFILDRQKQLSKSIGKKDYQITPEEYNKAVVEFFGAIPVPADAAKVISQSPTELIYEDAQGKRKRLFRNTDSNLGVETGRIEESLLSSPITGVDPKLQGLQDQLINQISSNLKETQGKPAESWMQGLRGTADRLAGQTSLASLDPASAAALKAISDSQQAQLQQQFQDQSGQLAAQLFGQGINRSSIAGEQANRLLQGQGLVQAQALSDAAQRELAVRQFLNQLLQGNLALAGDQYATGAELSIGQNESQYNILGNILSNILQREVSGEQLLQGRNELALQREQFDKNYGLNRDQFEVQAKQARQAARRSLINSIVSGAVGLATGLPLGSLFGSIGGGTSPKPVTTATRSGGYGGYY